MIHRKIRIENKSFGLLMISFAALLALSYPLHHEINKIGKQIWENKEVLLTAEDDVLAVNSDGDSDEDEADYEIFKPKNLPTKRLPDERMPRDRIPSAPWQENLPPVETMPKHRIPSNRIPDNRAPVKTMPKGRIPSNRLPSNPIPSNRVPDE